MAEDKKSQIIATAITRFSHYGIAKTSMSEIADDMNLSKANLYYYFPDKFSLIEAIVEQIAEEWYDKINDALAVDRHTTLDLLMLMLEIKQECFSKYLLLIKDLHALDIREERWSTLVHRVFLREQETIASVFERGIARGELVTFDVGTTSELYVSIIRGLGMVCDSCTPDPVMEMDDVKRVIEKQKQTAAIVINGIKKT